MLPSDYHAIDLSIHHAGIVMQYILTQEEKDALVPRAELDARDALLDKLREGILRVANFTCIHDRVGADGKKLKSLDRGYCDACPVSASSTNGWTPEIKAKSMQLSYAEDELACTRAKRYGQ